VELEMVQRAAQTYRTDSVKAPLYRLPTIAVDQALPELLTAGVLKPAELHSLLSCGLLVRDINRGLDQAASIAPRTIDEEANRLTLKCRHLLDEPNHEASVERALAIVARHVRRHDWYR
jgi:hypothetical protein